MEPRRFEYRPHIRWMQYGLIALLGMGQAIPLLIFALRHLSRGDLVLPYFAMAFIAALATLVIFWIYRSMASTQVLIDDRGIRYVNHRHDFTVSFEEIERLEVPRIPYLGGWLRIKSPHPDIRITVVFQDIDEFILLLREQLERRDNQEAYDRAKLFQFYVTSCLANRKWDLSLTSILPTVALSVPLLALAFTAWSANMTALTWILLLTPGIAAYTGHILQARVIHDASDVESFSVPDTDAASDRRYLLRGTVLTILLGTLPIGALLTIL